MRLGPRFIFSTVFYHAQACEGLASTECYEGRVSIEPQLYGPGMFSSLIGREAGGGHPCRPSRKCDVLFKMYHGSVVTKFLVMSPI
jgi:hypothetical protein